MYQYNGKITVQNTDISVVKYNEEDYISLQRHGQEANFKEHIIFRWHTPKKHYQYLVNGKCCVSILNLAINLKMRQKQLIRSFLQMMKSSYSSCN